MNILYISSEYPPETGYGGIGTYTKYIAEGMAKRNHVVSVVARSNSNRESITNLNGVTIYRLPPLPYPLPAHRYAYILRKFATRFFPHALIRTSWALAVRKKVTHLCSRCPQFDIIETPECGAENVFVPKQSAKRCITRLHTPWEMIRVLDNIKEPFGDRLFLPYLEKTATRRTHAVSSPSRALASHISEHWRINNITIIPNPLPLDHFHQSSGSGWIYTGRIERRKGVHHLIAAYCRLSDITAHPPPLMIIGNAYGTETSGISYGTFIRRMIASQKNSHAISWITNATLDDVARYLRDSSVAFFPSLWENYPYACLEAMASGCAVVASNCGGFPEIIESGENGLLIRSDSEESLYNAMKYLIDNNDKITVLGAAAKKRVSELVSDSRICEEMEHYYMSVVEETG